jgi:hypothetical protein
MVLALAKGAARSRAAGRRSHGSPDRIAEPPRVGRSRARVRATRSGSEGDSDLRAPVRSRPLQGDQRRLRPPSRRPCAEGLCRNPVVAARRQQLRGAHGGEEFAAILPGANQTAAVRAAESVRSAFESSAACVEGVAVRGTVSVGACSDAEADCDLGTLFHRADTALTGPRTRAGTAWSWLTQPGLRKARPPSGRSRGSPSPMSAV